MQFRSIGFLPFLMTVMMGALFALKFHTESKRTEFALQVRALIDETEYNESATWMVRRSNYLEALRLLDEARAAKIDLNDLVDEVMEGIEVDPAYAAVVGVTLLKNLDLADEYRLFSEENQQILADGGELKIGDGGHKGEIVILDNLVPHRFSPELEMCYANLMLKPKSIVRHYPDRFENGSRAVLAACRQADVVSERSFERAMRAIDRGGIY